MARSFAGADWVSPGNSSVWAPTDVSVFCWIKPTSVPHAYNAVIGYNSANWEFFVTSGPSMAFYNHTGSVDPGSHSLTTGTWYHVGFTGSNSGNSMKTFVNGASDGTAVYSTLSSSQELRIGSDPQTAGREYNGSIADVGIWNVLLTSGEISALASGARPSTIRPSNLIAYWPLDGLSSPEPDISGNARNGTLTGTSAASGPPIALLTPRRPSFLPAAAAAAATVFPFWKTQAMMDGVFRGNHPIDYGV